MISIPSREKGLEFGLSIVKKFLVVSCSNGYWSYVTTPKECSRQNYEGGHNLYGPEIGYFLAVILGHMVEDLVKKGSGSVV